MSRVHKSDVAISFAKWVHAAAQLVPDHVGDAFVLNWRDAPISDIHTMDSERDTNDGTCMKFRIGFGDCHSIEVVIDAQRKVKSCTLCVYRDSAWHRYHGSNKSQMLLFVHVLTEEEFVRIDAMETASGDVDASG